MAAEATNQAKRVLDLLTRFNKGEIINIDTLGNNSLWLNANNEPVNERTIIRALNVIREFFPNSFSKISGRKGTYQGISNSVFTNLLDIKVLSFVSIAYDLLKKSGMDNVLGESEKSIIEARVKESNKCYEFLTRPFEDFIKSSDIISNLERAITNRQKITISYKTNKMITYRDIHPYKMVFMNENLYLICDVDGNSQIFRVRNINKVELSKHTFHQNPHIIEFLKKIQTPFSVYKKDEKNEIEVLLKINDKKARFFKNKKFLKSQKIEQNLENGDIVVKYTVTNFNEITSFILSWLPNVEVLEPKELKDEINTMLKSARV